MASSPLTAIHRPSAVPGWGSNDIFSSVTPSHPAASHLRAGPLNLHEQLQRGYNPEYFNLKDIRGSSPAASLAADLSQNFSLDSDARFVNPFYLLFSPILALVF